MTSLKGMSACLLGMAVLVAAKPRVIVMIVADVSCTALTVH
jgi:hypothetical protein